nr:immunoglobulin heavy chain junction region [Macaca mulatta]
CATDAFGSGIDSW